MLADLRKYSTASELVDQIYGSVELWTGGFDIMLLKVKWLCELCGDSLMGDWMLDSLRLSCLEHFRYCEQSKK